MQRPNVLILYTDQQRWDAMRCAGNEFIHTPNLDALAKNGAMFENSFANTPVCMPSRMSMQSGRYPAALGICCNGIEMPERIPCMHNVLKPYGYHSANIGKLHFKNHSNRDHREPHPTYGFDTLINSDEPGCYDDAYTKWVFSRNPDMLEKCRVDTPPAWEGKPIKKHPRNTHQPYLFEAPDDYTHSAFVADETCGYIKAHKDDPFFCIAGFYAPHTPVNPPKRFVDMYDQKSMPLPERNSGENFEDVSDEQWRKTKAYYYALVSHVDDQIGRILKTLDESGLRDNTIIIFTSDHGEYLGDHGRIQKGGPEDASARTPLIISYSDSLKNQKISGIVEAVDIAPTVLDLCGVQVPPYMQGKSLRPLLEGKECELRTSAFIEHRFPFGDAYKAVRTREYLYSMDNSGNETLYDLQNDPHQLCDAAGNSKYATALAEMRAEMLKRWFDAEGQYPLRTGMY